MILEILTYTHNITTMLFGIFLSAFFPGCEEGQKECMEAVAIGSDFRGLIYGLRISAGSGDGGSDIPADRSRAAIADAGVLL